MVSASMLLKEGSLTVEVVNVVGRAAVRMLADAVPPVDVVAAVEDCGAELSAFAEAEGADLQPMRMTESARRVRKDLRTKLRFKACLSVERRYKSGPLSVGMQMSGILDAGGGWCRASWKEFATMGDAGYRKGLYAAPSALSFSLPPNLGLCPRLVYFVALALVADS
jgi:hypothetical protein